MSAVVPRPGDVLRAESGREYRLQAWHAEGSYARVFRAEGAPCERGSELGARSPERGKKGLPLGPLSPRGRGGTARSVVREGSPSSEPRAPARSEGPCAIKLAKAEVAGSAELMTREVEVRRRFRHPHVPELLDTGCAGDLPFLALAWVEGPTLRAMVERQRRLPLVVALALLRDVAAVTVQMHASGLAHGDLRPDNILVANGEGRARAMVTDLGSAPRRGEDEPGAGAADDVRRLAELLYLMLTGTTVERDPSRLSTLQGHHPGAVRLWETATRGSVSASAFLREVEALQRSIGVR